MLTQVPTSSNSPGNKRRTASMVYCNEEPIEITSSEFRNACGLGFIIYGAGKWVWGIGLRVPHRHCVTGCEKRKEPSVAYGKTTSVLLNASSAMQQQHSRGRKTRVQEEAAWQKAMGASGTRRERWGEGELTDRVLEQGEHGGESGGMVEGRKGKGGFIGNDYEEDGYGALVISGDSIRDPIEKE
ncbi:hypothetical protein M0804_011025 [Polistes exclamans]|nr:hypothetical protein M0804_011025 [Polistes exclamans]